MTRRLVNVTQLRYEDPGVRMVAEFHDAFGCAHSEAPSMPVLKDYEAETLREASRRVAELALELKLMAARANQAGHLVLGLMLIRLQLMVEEPGEVAEAMSRGDLADVLHELADCRYVVNGTALTFGLGHLVPAADRELHAANMTKLDAEGKPIIDASGRVVKPPHYRKPDMAAVLRDYEEETSC